MNKIPKIIHYVWVGGKDKPKKIINCMLTWKKKYPDYIIKEWNEDNFDINSNVYVKTAYEEKKWAFVSDYIRMYAIYNEGGIYFDTDVIAIDTLDDLLDNECFIGYESNNMPFTAVFGAKKHHPLIKRILELYDSLDKKFDSSATNTIIISNLLVNEYQCKLGNKEQMLKNNVLVLPKEVLCNPSLKSKTIHAFSMSWKEKNNTSLIGRFDVYLRGKMTSKKRIVFYRIMEILVFYPKRFLGPKIRRFVKGEEKYEKD